MPCSHRNKRPNQRYCWSCHAFYQRKWRRTKKGRDSTKRHNKNLKKTQLIYAKAQVFVLVRTGKIPKPTAFKCTDCKSKAEVYDHRDYNFPLRIDAVCRRCNAKRGAGKNRLLKAA